MEISMTSRAKRLERLEAAFMPSGKPFVIWGMTGECARKSEQDIQAEIAVARSAGRMASRDRPVIIVCWRTDNTE